MFWILERGIAHFSLLSHSRNNGVSTEPEVGFLVDFLKHKEAEQAKHTYFSLFS